MEKTINITYTSYKLNQILSLLKKTQRILLDIEDIPFDDQDYVLLQLECAEEQILKIHRNIYLQEGYEDVY